MDTREILVIGGGASGLMAAITAAEAGGRVTILEHNSTMGKKLLATGNGRCNFSNITERPDAYRSSVPDFAKSVLSQFTVQETVAFFSRLGIYARNRDGGLYPYSNQASSVVEVLRMEAERLKVKLKTNVHIETVYPKDGRWHAVTKGWEYQGDKVILACGSAASDIAGADGSGYALARELGHKVIKPLSALAPLVCTGADFGKWAGVRAEGIIHLLIEGEAIREERGELQLTAYGISGIPVFQLSRYASRALEKGKIVQAELDFFPDFDKEALSVFLAKRKEDAPNKTEKELLIGLFPDKLIPELFKQPDLITAIKAFPLTVRKTKPLSLAQVACGGVDTAQVDENTLESRLHPGLYFTGELLDVDGACGGYNLQWAWSSGHVAGFHAVKGDTL